MQLLNSDLKWKDVICPTYLGYVKAIFAITPHTVKESGPFIPEFVNVSVQ